MLISFLLILLAVYITFTGIMYLLQRSFIYFPDRHRPNLQEWNVLENAEIARVKTSDNLELEGWFFPPKENKPVLVHFHGNAGHIGYRIQIIKPYVQAGYGALLAEYRGYGGNPGKPSEQGFYKDGRAYIQWLKEEKNMQQNRIVLYGESIGAGTAIQMAYENKGYAALILEAPFSSAVDIARQTYPFLPVNILLKDRYMNRDKIGDINTRLLIIHGKKDTIIPANHAQALYNIAEEPKKLILLDEAGHNDLHLHKTPLHVLDFLSTI